MDTSHESPDESLPEHNKADQTKITDPDYQPESESEHTPKNSGAKSVRRANLLQNILLEQSEMTEMTPLVVSTPIAESTRNCPAGSQVGSQVGSQPQAHSSQNDSLPGVNEDAKKALIQFLARKTLPIDWIYVNGEIKVLNDKNCQSKKSKPLYIEYEPNHDLEKLATSSKLSDISNDRVIPMNKETFRELLGKYPDSFRLVKLGGNHLKCLNRNYGQKDNEFHLPTNFWFLQFIQVGPINDEKHNIHQEKDNYNQTTGKSLNLINKT